MITTHPALALLARKKFVGIFRKQVRRLKTVKGAIFAFFGILVFTMWFGSLLLGQFAVRPGHGGDAAVVLTADTVQVSIFFLVVFTVMSSLGFRGLFLPKDEIELLFSAPVSRSDVIRYRLLTNIGRSLFGGVIVGLIATKRAPNPWYGFVGTFLAVQALPLLSQGISLAVGSAESRVASKTPRNIARIAGILGFALYLAIVLMLVTNANEKFVGWLRDSATGRGFAMVFTDPWLLAVSSICRPWAHLITAASPGEFLSWLVICVGIWIVLFELVARIPVDYRELSLQTASDVAKRLNRMRRTGGASAGQVSKRAASWHVPWLFGRGRFGAIAWLKTGSILRKARSTLIVSIAILSLITFFAAAMLKSGKGEGMEPMVSIFMAFFGCMYLCGGLRFDFREDLDRMEFLKTCPAPAWVVFLATVTPQIVLVSLLMAVAVLLKSVITGIFPDVLPLVVLSIPLLCFTWVAIDNVVFLASPVRYVAGQDTVLQNAGRAVVMMFVRFLILLGVVVSVGIPVLLGFGARQLFPSLGVAAVIAGGALGVLAWCVDCGILTAAGAWQLRHFDVSRDRA